MLIYIEVVLLRAIALTVSSAISALSDCIQVRTSETTFSKALVYQLPHVKLLHDCAAYQIVTVLTTTCCVLFASHVVRRSAVAELST
jgi:hypothetical protein